MTKGRIEIRKVDLMGFTPETQVYYIVNGGGAGSRAVARFLQKNLRHFDQSLMMGSTYLSLPAKRIAGFRNFAAMSGFEVAEGARI